LNRPCISSAAWLSKPGLQLRVIDAGERPCGGGRRRGAAPAHAAGADAWAGRPSRSGDAVHTSTAVLSCSLHSAACDAVNVLAVVHTCGARPNIANTMHAGSAAAARHSNLPAAAPGVVLSAWRRGGSGDAHAAAGFVLLVRSVTQQDPSQPCSVQCKGTASKRQPIRDVAHLQRCHVSRGIIIVCVLYSVGLDVVGCIMTCLT
jgi:hypothetical protein